MIKTISSITMNCSTITLARIANNGYHNATAGSAPAATVTAAVTNGRSVNVNVKCIKQTQHIMSNNHQKTFEKICDTIQAGAAMATTPNKTTFIPKKPELAAKIIQQSDIVCFDVDSTVICEEGIDELADFCGKGVEVARVTKEAMGGAMTFQDALRIRLNIIRPTQKQISDFIKLRPSKLTQNVKRFIEVLKSNGKQVYLISGGFDCLIEPVANELGIPLNNVFANKFLFTYNGDYANFDSTQPTSRSGGKAEAISMIKQKYPDALITMIGDGATDLEAVPPANYFIGYGGNVLRAEVYKRAQYYISDFGQLY